MNMFLGEDVNFWHALKSRAENLGVVGLIREIAFLRAKVSFYEDRVHQINVFRDTLEGEQQ